MNNIFLFSIWLPTIYLNLFEWMKKKKLESRPSEAARG